MEEGCWALTVGSEGVPSRWGVSQLRVRGFQMMSVGSGGIPWQCGWGLFSALGDTLQAQVPQVCGVGVEPPSFMALPACRVGSLGSRPGHLGQVDISWTLVSLWWLGVPGRVLPSDTSPSPQPLLSLSYIPEQAHSSCKWGNQGTGWFP